MLNLSPALATGLILVSCCPGGQVSLRQQDGRLLHLLLCKGCLAIDPRWAVMAQRWLAYLPGANHVTNLHCVSHLRDVQSAMLHQASNVATYIAHGDVALSVLMTTASTVGAIFMTPLLVKFLAGALVPVDAKVRATTSCFRDVADDLWRRLPVGGTRHAISRSCAAVQVLLVILQLMPSACSNAHHLHAAASSATISLQR